MIDWKKLSEWLRQSGEQLTETDRVIMLTYDEECGFGAYAHIGDDLESSAFRGDLVSALNETVKPLRVDK